ncbi:hypothetical protein HTV13_23910 [Pseudomonas putida]|uniref:hypothetical protein n=1 Tax=Pseudomonas TaxID=286 RepID=UPI000E6ABE1A|nr:hypothetical protein [Pseudomonas putida]NSX22859.1 hypothetical protein [Pseudomonas putida]
MLFTIAPEECQRIGQKLALKLDITNDLPARVFLQPNLDYWFFERSLLSDLGLLESLLIESHRQFSSGMGVLFSWGTPDCTGRLFDGSSTEESVFELQRQSFRPPNTPLELPHLVFSPTHEWLAYESAFEEWGVLAMDRSLINTEFAGYLNREFISIGEAWRLSKLEDFNGILARAFLRNYACV